MYSSRNESSERINSGAKITLVAVLVFSYILTQYFYDQEKIHEPKTESLLSLSLIKTFDLGLHSAAASFLWIGTRSEIFTPHLFNYDVGLVNNLDPKFNVPYIYSVINLPVIPRYPNGVEVAIEIGKRGLDQADPDWRIPFYLAATYQVHLQDPKNAAKYFDIAANTPGVPDVVRRFAVNYGAFPSLREKTKQIWVAIYESAKDDETKEHARAYIVHLEIIDFLQGEVNTYHARYQKYPRDVQDLVSQKIISEIPKDPFGFEFALYENGVVGIKKAQE